MLHRVLSFFQTGNSKIAIFLLCFITTNAWAITRTTIVTEIQRGDNIEKRTDVFTVDGNQARLDLYGEDTSVKMTSYMLTVDGGKTWYLSDPKDKQTICTQWDTRAFFTGVGELIHFAQDLVGADVKEEPVEVTLNEPGPEMLGHKTRHLKLRYSLNAVAWLLFIKREYKLEFQDEVWVSTDLKLSDIEQTWVDAMSETGYAKLDRLSKKWNEKVPGTVIKLISDVNLRNITKNENREKQERVQITRIEALKSEDIAPELFKVPTCKKVSEEEMEQAAKEMLSGIAK